MVPSTIAFASLALASACHAQIFFRLIETEVACTSRAELHTPPTPLVGQESDSDTTRPFPDVETDVELGRGTFAEPRIRSWGDGGGRLLDATSFFMNSSVNFSADSSSHPAPPRRVAAGSWRQYAKFEIYRAAQLHLSVRPSLFDDLSYTEYTPGTLTDADGNIIVSGQPTGSSTWIWQVTLAPGVYTFEASAAYEIAFDDGARQGDSARHTVDLSLRPLPCLADFDGDGELTVFDFLAYLNAFDAGRTEADLDDDGMLTIFDFLVFQNAFDAGCG
ncbi:MAG: GC-type dockerin domain-anchored protein [Phycisphaerales bacterium]|jgi:hypothetical protein